MLGQRKIGLRLPAIVLGLLGAVAAVAVGILSSGLHGARAAGPVPAQLSGGFVDTTVGDFGLGTIDSNTYIAETGDGEVILAPTAGVEFSGSTLPPGWFCAAWSGSCSGVVAGGSATLNSVRIGTGTSGLAGDATGLHAPGRALDFAATFSGAANQHAGFGLTFNESVWAIFSTRSGPAEAGGARLFARTHTGSISLDTDLGPAALGASHRYRVEWSATGVVYTIDGVEVATHSIAPTSSLRPLASDFGLDDGTPLVVDWMRLSPYPPSPGEGVYQSRIFDASVAAEWQTLEAITDLAGGSILLETRTGDAADTSDPSWSAFVPVSGTLINSPNGRFLQYQATLETTNPDTTPALEQVTVMFVESCAGAPDGTSCSDGDVCNGEEICAGGVCTAGTSLDCDDNDACTSDSCDPVDGCAHDAVVCDDGNACTLDACDPLSGCTATPVPDGTSCADASVCNGDETCQSGVCTPGTVLECDDDNPCTTDSCDPVGGCTHTAASSVEEFSGTSLPPGWGSIIWASGGTVVVGGGTLTVDGAAARTDATFGAGSSARIVATFGAEPFQHAGFAGGGDTDPQIFNSAPWALFSTGSAGTALQARTWDGATFNDETLAGSFLGTPHVYRIDWAASSVSFFIDDVLVTSHAVSLGGAMRVAVSDFTPSAVSLVVDSAGTPPACDDGNACTTGDVCSGTVCVGGTPPDCDDGDACTADSCDPGSGCVNTVAVTCDDGDLCTTEACNPTTGLCESGGSVVCPEDGNPCTIELCNPSNGVCEPAPSPSLSESFPGPDLPPGWSSFGWSEGGTVTVGGGSLTVDGSLAGTDTAFAPGRSLQFVATFRNQDFQHAGFGGGGNTPPRTFETAPWAIFSNGALGTVLQARTWDGATVIDETIPGEWLGAPHTYRIDWAAGGVAYFIDGELVATHALSIASPMRVAVSDLFADGAIIPLVVGSLTLLPGCDDGSACTVGDVCSGTSCTPGIPLTAHEVARDLRFSDAATLLWSASSVFSEYNRYRGTIDGGAWAFDQACLEPPVSAPTFTDAESPATPGTAHYYLISGRHVCGEGTLGKTSSGTPRPNVGPCP